MEERELGVGLKSEDGKCSFISRFIYAETSNAALRSPASLTGRPYNFFLFTAC